MKAQSEETVDAAVKVGLLRDELMAEDALRRGEDYLRLTIDTIPVLAWCSRPDGSNEFLNQRWLDYTARAIRRCDGVAIPLEEELDWIEIASGKNAQDSLITSVRGAIRVRAQHVRM